MDEMVRYERAVKIVETLTDQKIINSPLVDKKPGIDGIDDIRRFLIVLPKLVLNGIFPHLMSKVSEIRFSETENEIEAWLKAFTEHSVRDILLTRVQIFDLDSERFLYSLPIQADFVIQSEESN